MKKALEIKFFIYNAVLIALCMLVFAMGYVVRESSGTIRAMQEQIKQQNKISQYYVDLCIDNAIQQEYWIKYDQKRSYCKYEDFYSEKLQKIMNGKWSILLKSIYKIISDDNLYYGFTKGSSAYDFVLLKFESDKKYNIKNIAEQLDLTRAVTRGIIYQMIHLYENTEYEPDIHFVFKDFGVKHTFH